MEKIMDFDQWYLDFKPVPVEYVAVFDPNTGEVKSVGPSHAFINEKHKVPVDSETAEAIINAEIKISSCVVDINSQKLEIAELKTVYKIDDVLHRVVSIEYVNMEKPDIYITHNAKKKTLKLELSTEFGGTKKPNIGVKQRNVIWSGDTEMNFLITDYNDPNLLYELISVKINDLIGKSKIIKDFRYTDFSIYTRRLFKNYVIEHK